MREAAAWPTADASASRKAWGMQATGPVGVMVKVVGTICKKEMASSMPAAKATK